MSIKDLNENIGSSGGANSYLEIAYFISRDLISKTNRDEIFEKIALTAKNFINCDLVTIFMLDEESENINCVKFYKDGQFLKKDMQINFGEGIIGAVVENGEPLLSTDLKTDLSGIYFEIEKQFSEMASILSVPIFAGSLVIGALNIYGRESREWTADEISSIKFIALMGGTFIYSLTLYENANFLYVKQKEESKKVEDLLKVSRLVSSNLDLNKVAEDSVKSLMDFTGAERSLLYLKDEINAKSCYEFFNCDMKKCPLYGGSVNCYTLKNFECRFVKCPPTDAILQKCSDCPYFNNIDLELFKNIGFEDSNISSEFSGVATNKDLIQKMHVPDKFSLKDCECVKSVKTGYPTINYYDNKGVPQFICDCIFRKINKKTLIAIPLKTEKDFIGMVFLFSDKEILYSSEQIDFISDLSSIVSVSIANSMMIDYIEEAHFDAISSISEAIEARDAYTRSHGDRLIDYGVIVGKELGLSENEIKNLRYAASLHDVGKIGISDSILNKQGKLTDEEYEKMKKHPEIGYNMLKKIKFLSQISNDVLYHQERYDGKGYPAKLKGNEIPLISRIIAVVDTFDAMTTDRPYRKALPVEAALEELRKNSGTQFDPKVVDAFLKAVSEDKLSMGAVNSNNTNTI